jgi:hypothetical protein
VENPFTDTTQFYIAGESEISLPPGNYKLNVYKGIEYGMVAAQVEIASGERVEHKVEMSRWINMAEQGWYSGDDHLHIARPVEGLNPYISKIMQAEDVKVANLLQFGLARRFHNTIQYAHGPEGVYREGDYILATGQENPRTHFLGHVITLGARAPINHPDAYLVYRLFFEEVRRQGALSGFAHFGADLLGGHYGLAVVLPHDLLAFLEVLQFNRPNYSTWYDVLNLGFRVTPTAGTDYPCAGATIPGRERFYTRIDGTLTYDNWLDGIRAGRTFVTNGPMLEFRVNDKEMGEAFTLEDPTSVAVEGRVRFDRSRDAVERLELVENGRVVRSFPMGDDSGEISFEIEHPVQETCWLALRASGDKIGEVDRPTVGRPFEPTSAAHSAPVHVVLRGAPRLADHSRARDVMSTWLARLEDLEVRLGQDNIEALATKLGESPSDLADEGVLRRDRSALIDEIRKAKDYFMHSQH